MSNYNQRLFSRGLRRYLHHMRFEWLKRQLAGEKDKGYSMFELGCFDCRSLSFLPQPARYLGADANWEGGLDEARMYYSTTPGMELVKAQSVRDLEAHKNAIFDYSVSLETLEHIPDEQLVEYVAFLARVTKKRLIISVPVEIGPIFLAKHIAKSLSPSLHSGETSTYTLKEVFWATLGRADRVTRFEHKGFDYRKLIALISRYFTITKIEGIPIRFLPMLSFQVGIIAEPKA